MTAPRPLVIGVDPSLTSTGVASHDWADALSWKGPTGHERLEWLRAEIADRTKQADLVVIEGPSHGSAMQAGHHEMAGLWWHVTHDLWRRRIPYAVASPHNLKIYATGVANPAKDELPNRRARVSKGIVHTFVTERLGLPCEGPGRYDAADAAVLAAIGQHGLGHPLIDLPSQHTRALATVRWPVPMPLCAEPVGEVA